MFTKSKILITIFHNRSPTTAPKIDKIWDYPICDNRNRTTSN